MPLIILDSVLPAVARDLYQAHAIAASLQGNSAPAANTAAANTAANTVNPAPQAPSVQVPPTQAITGGTAGQTAATAQTGAVPTTAPSGPLNAAPTTAVNQPVARQQAPEYTNNVLHDNQWHRLQRFSSNVEGAQGAIFLFCQTDDSENIRDVRQPLNTVCRL